MKKLLINLTVLITILSTTHASATDNKDPIRKYLGEEVAIAAEVFLEELDRCDDPDFECDMVIKENPEKELTKVMHDTFLESMNLSPELFSISTGLAAAAGREIAEVIKAGAQAVIDVHQTEKRMKEMKRKLQQQADENGYGDIFYDTVRDIK